MGCSRLFCGLSLFIAVLVLVVEAQQLLQETVSPHKDINSNTIDTKKSLLRSFSNNTIYKENHKPIFKDCENYKPEVKEEQDKGTPVITVFADDPDPKNKKGGRVAYKIVRREDERVYFNIDNSTGEITTNMPFDRDEPYRQKELYVTVQATDDGWPVLADICIFKVTITDINDNAPSFDQVEYHAQIAEDGVTGREVTRVFAYDFDEGDNSRLTYSFSNESTEFNDFFKIDSATGVVFLKQSLAGKRDKKFISTVIVHDNGENPNSARAEIAIKVVGSDKRAPTIRSDLKEIYIKENMNDFEKPLVYVSADSEIADKSVAFELVKGKTVQTNKDSTFQLRPSSDNNSAIIMLARPLDYETVTEYQLTVRAQNKDLLGASLNIAVKVEDVNDEIPTFIELLKGSVVENDVIGAQAMQVRAIDKDGTSPNNLVRYELVDQKEHFEINSETGIITAKTVFDRESEALYHVTVKAYDGNPSAILRDRQPNSVFQTFQISIEDRNDNPPQFTKSIYTVQNIPESADIFKDVIEVKAVDRDDAALILYSIIDGNVGDAFHIEDTTGRIKVNNQLDFEKHESYNLTVRAFDGTYEDTATVVIFIQNENDEPPIFQDYNKTIQIEEETLSEGCIIHLKAYDPDIKDRTVDQRIVYKVAKEHKWFLDVTSDGCVSLISKLDRDLPNGAPQYQGYILAYDNDGGSNALSKSAEINIVLIDINDNAPILNKTEVVWYENEMPGKIVTLTAFDYDGPTNGPPFTYEISDDVSQDIREKFSVINQDLMAETSFDREEKKYYDVRINITDSGTPPKSGVSVLRVIIGDRNDNEAKDGSSEIFVYKYVGLKFDIKIGRVYVDDPDDWDLPDKVFQAESDLQDNFYLDSDDKGMIVMSQGVPPGTYELMFLVTEEHLPDIPRHTVRANVSVQIKEIPEEAVIKSGSIRLSGSSIEEFVEKGESGLSNKDLLQRRLAKALNTSVENVDVFTVIPSPSNDTTIDVRFSAHGSPYYAPEKLNNKATDLQDQLEKELGVSFVMVSISECLLGEGACPQNSSCSDSLTIKDDPAVVFTNKTSFVGVKAVIEPICDCISRRVHECFNGGLPTDGGCSCPEGFEGPHCEILGIGFDGDGWALYPTFDTCNVTSISLSVMAKADDGLIFYVGPLSIKHTVLVKDYMSLELRNGYVLLKMDLGDGPLEVFSNRSITDGAAHKIKISITTEDVQLIVDECLSDCLKWSGFIKSGLLNVNGPLQLGGLRNAFPLEVTKNLWGTVSPTNRRFQGCISNLTYNSYVYNLGLPSDSYRAHINCDYSVTQAVTFGIDSNFLVAILVCVAILLILLLAVVIHKKKQDNLNEKDMDDTRENIINYEDEGGGECDTNFDLSVLRPNHDEKPPIRDNFYTQAPDVPTDISGFLDTKKRACDKDPENLPYDDVRHYGYEGDGNTSGSLSSLASCTDEGDLKFNYLSSFGPRFRKLADMYGDDASEEGSQNGGEESWC